LILWVSATSIIFLALLGSTAAKVGGANILTGAWRVTFWGVLAMLITAGIGTMFNAAV
jgi:VIT1/CCC1 family predicted Fe2+/Mn2+ transporter